VPIFDRKTALEEFAKPEEGPGVRYAKIPSSGFQRPCNIAFRIAWLGQSQFIFLKFVNFKHISVG